MRAPAPLSCSSRPPVGLGTGRARGDREVATEEVQELFSPFFGGNGEGCGFLQWGRGCFRAPFWGLRSHSGPMVALCSGATSRHCPLPPSQIKSLSPLTPGPSLSLCLYSPEPQKIGNKQLGFFPSGSGCFQVPPVSSGPGAGSCWDPPRGLSPPCPAPCHPAMSPPTLNSMDFGTQELSRRRIRAQMTLNRSFNSSKLSIFSL